MCPNEFIRVEFRSIGWKPIDVEPLMPFDKGLHFSPPVNGATIPEEEDKAAKMLKHIPEKEPNLRPGDVGHVERDEQAHSLALRRNRDRGDRGNPVAFVAVPVDGSIARGRPCLADVGNEHEPAFIKEHEMGPKFLRFFLYAAMSSFSSARWRLRLAGWRDAPVSASSIPCFSAMGR